MLVHGNFSQTEAIATAQLIKDTLQCKPLFASQVPEQRVVCLADGNRYLRRMASFNPADPNSCVVAMIAIGEESVARNAALSVMAHIASEPCFNQLRTVETLGYLVWSGVAVTKGVMWYRLIVQSSEYAADYLEGRVEAFLEQFRVCVCLCLCALAFGAFWWGVVVSCEVDV
jgi:insulysin